MHNNWGSLFLGGYKYRDLALQVAGVSDETVKYGRQFCGTSTQEWLLWQGLEAIAQVNYRPNLSSERVPHIKKPAIVRQKTKIWPWAPDGSPIPRQTGRLTVGRKLTSFHFMHNVNYIESLTMDWTLLKVTDRRQTRPLVGEGAPQRQHSNVQTEYKIWSRVPGWTW
jgi:hypothetical protein